MLKHLYYRGNDLVTLNYSPIEKGLVIRPLAEAILREEISAAVDFEAESSKDGKIHCKKCHPPGWVVNATAQRGSWQHIPHLATVVSHPVLQPDGSILTRPGYDEASGIYSTCNLDLSSMPERPTDHDVAMAKAILENDLLKDFPFERPEHRSAALALLLTIITRPAIHGQSPAFLLDASTRGTGKTLLVKCILLVATGTIPGMTQYPINNEEELRKKITSLLIEGRQNIVFDNLNGTFGGGCIDLLLTAPFWDDRYLGENKMVHLPNSSIIIVTANNASVHSDTARRTLHVRLVSPIERPEDRRDFLHDDIQTFIEDNRDDLLRAAFTLIQRWIADGRPTHNLPPWGSFESWSKVVRSILVHAGYPDPLSTKDSLVDNEEASRDDLNNLLQGLSQSAELLQSSASPNMNPTVSSIIHQGGAMTAAQMIDLSRIQAHSQLRYALGLLSTERDQLTPKKLGKRLGRYKDLIADSLVLRASNRQHTMYWKVEHLPNQKRICPVSPVCSWLTRFS